MNYSVGDVLYAHIVFEDGTGTKPRPVVVLTVVDHPVEKRYLVAECYSDKEHYTKDKGVLIKENTDDYKCMGIDCDTFITPSLKAIFHRMVVKKFGTFPRVDWFKAKYKIK